MNGGFGMRALRVAVAQLAPRLGDVQANFETHLEWIARARDAGAGLVIFPELSLTGYHLKDLVAEVAVAIDDERLRRLAAEAADIDLVVGFVEDGRGHRFHNAAAYFSRGELLHVHRKVYLPTYGLFQEGRDFAPGESLRCFNTPYGPFGLLVCEDLWHGTSAWLLAQQGAEVLIALSNGPTRGARPDGGITSIGVWRDLLRVTAQFQTTFVLYANRVGVEDGLTFGGGSMAVDPFGRVLGEAPALEERLEIVELDPGVLRRARTAYPLLRDANLELVHRETARLRQLRYELPEERETPGPGRSRRRRASGERTGR